MNVHEHGRILELVAVGNNRIGIQLSTKSLMLQHHAP
jgi:hypothetical protein